MGKEPFTWEWLTRDGAVFFTAILAAIAFVQAFLFVWQLKLIRRTLKAARQRDEILERAYLWPGFGESYPLEGGRRRWFIRVWNSGKTVGILQTIHHALVTEDV